MWRFILAEIISFLRETSQWMAQYSQMEKNVFLDFSPNRVRKYGFMDIFGILRSSPIRGYPYPSCKSPEWVTTKQNV